VREKNLPPFSRLRVGASVTLAGSTYEVSDLRHAAYLSAEGELPFEPPFALVLTDKQGEDCPAVAEDSHLAFSANPGRLEGRDLRHAAPVDSAADVELRLEGGCARLHRKLVHEVLPVGPEHHKGIGVICIKDNVHRFCEHPVAEPRDEPVVIASRTGQVTGGHNHVVAFTDFIDKVRDRERQAVAVGAERDDVVGLDVGMRFPVGVADSGLLLMDDPGGVAPLLDDLNRLVL
jgi:hypothetical protein